MKHWSGIHAGVKLAALAARINFAGQFGEKAIIEFSTRKILGQLLDVDAGELGPQAAGDHLSGEDRRWHLPQREERLQTSVSQLRFAIGSHVLEEQITEGNRIDVFIDGTSADLAHSRLVICIGAGPWQRNIPQRQPCRLRLRFEHGSPSAMHGYTVELAI